MQACIADQKVTQGTMRSHRKCFMSKLPYIPASTPEYGYHCNTGSPPFAVGERETCAGDLNQGSTTASQTDWYGKAPSPIEPPHIVYNAMQPSLSLPARAASRKMHSLQVGQSLRTLRCWSLTVFCRTTLSSILRQGYVGTRQQSMTMPD
ncbi:hypothetical protein CTRI78_v008408 [Colletotrichum trifolii]|uniref:Uncharacterized protein n=1 Tax=Colletotrichum trifolii TaxID=5466 RepID=A0A4R8QUW5_COLTR|nr:hypothetical protein CTRI78_v008408 [Colletotrichum trifolii]